jgi:D-alanyl-D-alanine dipeptidase
MNKKALYSHLIAWGSMIPAILLAATIDLRPYPGLEDVSNLANVKLDFRYATSNNFLGKPVYGDFKQCYLQKIAADKFKIAAKSFEKLKPGWKLFVFDCLRPRSIQREMWALVKGTPKQKYVANPDTGSLHNFGFSVDLSLVDENGQEVDMGTPFDYFGPEAEPQKEAQFLKQGRLTQQEIDNRKLLRTIMVDSGFIPFPG